MPPLAWTTLTGGRGSLPAFSAAGVRRAVSDGIGRDGGLLNPIMPRYTLQPAEADALVGYLQRLGTSQDLPPGVDPTTIRLGTLLPLSGVGGAAGRAILLGLEQVISRANEGGIHGRRIELDAVDTVPAGAAAAARALLDKKPYAVVGGLWPSSDASVGPLFSSAHVGKIAGLMPRRSPDDLDEWDADLLPPLSTQQDALSADLAGRRGEARYGMLVGAAPSSRYAEGVRWFEDPALMLAAIREGPPAGVVAIGFGASPAVTAALPPGWTEDVVLPFPTALLEGSPGGAGPALWTELGRAAGRLAVELLSRAGSQLSERSILAALGGLGGFEPHPGAPARFAPDRRYAWDAGVVTLLSPSARPVDGE